MSVRRRVGFRWENGRGHSHEHPCEIRWSTSPPFSLDPGVVPDEEDWLPLHPERRRQLSNPVILWRGPSGAREGLLLGVRPDLSRRATGSVACVDALRIGADGLAACDDHAGLGVLRPNGEPDVERNSFSIGVDLALGETIPDPEEPRDADAESWIARELDAALLDHLHRESLSFEGIDPDGRCRLESLSDRPPGDFLPFDSAYPRARVDGFRVAGRAYYVDELYCPLPDCPCRDVVIRVYASGGDRSVPEKTGVVRLRPPWTDAEVEPTRSENEAALLAVLERYHDRHPNPERFEERRRRVAVVGALLAERRVPGRNGAE